MLKSKSLIKFNDLSLTDVPLLENYQRALSKIVTASAYTLGLETEKFEEEICFSEKSNFAVAVNSGTSALIIALKALGIGEGDQVITTNLTFAATCFSILEVGATPVLLDIDPLNLIMNSKLLKDSITEKTKAIVLVTLHGRSHNLEMFYSFAKDNNLKMIIDGAQSQLAKYKGSNLVNYCDLLTLSFYPGKNLGSLGEGGCILGKDTDLERRIKLMRNWGMKKKYIAQTWGGNFRIENLQSAFLRIKLGVLPQLTNLRIEKAHYYFDNLPTRILFEKPSEVGSHVFHIFSIKTKKRKLLMKRFDEENIQYGIHYPIPISKQPYYANKCLKPLSLKESEKISKQIISIPFHPHIKRTHLNRVITLLSNFDEN